MCKNQEQHAYKVYEIIMSSIIEFVSGLRTVYRKPSSKVLTIEILVRIDCENLYEDNTILPFLFHLRAQLVLSF